jgi:hypothetical protein
MRRDFSGLQMSLGVAAFCFGLGLLAPVRTTAQANASPTDKVTDKL